MAPNMNASNIFMNVHDITDIVGVTHPSLRQYFKNSSRDL